MVLNIHNSWHTVIKSMSDPIICYALWILYLPVCMCMVHGPHELFVVIRSAKKLTSLGLEVSVLCWLIHIIGLQPKLNQFCSHLQTLFFFQVHYYFVLWFVFWYFMLFLILGIWKQNFTCISCFPCMCCMPCPDKCIQVTAIYLAEAHKYRAYNLLVADFG
jgi:hypothetical protein